MDIATEIEKLNYKAKELIEKEYQRTIKMLERTVEMQATEIDLMGKINKEMYNLLEQLNNTSYPYHIQVKVNRFLNRGK